MAPGGGILLVPFTRAVIVCLFLITSTVFIMGVARIHMFILSFLCAGMWISLGVFQTEYTKFMNNRDGGEYDLPEKKLPSKKAPAVSSAKRED